MKATVHPRHVPSSTDDAETRFEDPKSGHDLAVLSLAKDPPARADGSARRPATLNRKPLTMSTFGGRSITAIGYGSESGSGSVSAIKTHVAMVVRAMSAHDLKAGDAEGTTCHGDSGGPVLGLVDGAVAVVGVTSYGPPDCSGSSYSTRVDDNSDFLAAFVGGAGKEAAATLDAEPSAKPTAAPESTTDATPDETTTDATAKKKRPASEQKTTDDATLRTPQAGCTAAPAVPSSSGWLSPLVVTMAMLARAKRGRRSRA